MPRTLRIPLAAILACAAIVAGHVVLGPDDDAPPPPEPPACEVGETVPGIDVSYYQQRIAWQRVRRAGVRFAFIRVSDGTTVSDPRFAANWAGARRAGLMRGAYQYFRPEESAIAQADLLITALARDRGELPPVIDIETDGGLTRQQLQDRARVWVARVRARLGVEPIVYTGPEFWRARAGGADLTSQPLWIAHYTSNCPKVPAPWTVWTFWQHSDRGRIRGITGKVDLSVFAGTMRDLEDFARRSRRR